MSRQMFEGYYGVIVIPYSLNIVNSLVTCIAWFTISLWWNLLFQITAKSVLKLWEKLYASFARLSSMVVNVEANIGCEEFAGRVLSSIDDLNLKVRFLFIVIIFT